MKITCAFPTTAFTLLAKNLAHSSMRRTESSLFETIAAAPIKPGESFPELCARPQRLLAHAPCHVLRSDLAIIPIAR